MADELVRVLAEKDRRGDLLTTKLPTCFRLFLAIPVAPSYFCRVNYQAEAEKGLVLQELNEENDVVFDKNLDATLAKVFERNVLRLFLILLARLRKSIDGLST